MNKPYRKVDGAVGIGCSEFARIVGASYPEVSRAATAGLITVVGKKSDGSGTRGNVLDREQAFRIAAAVQCGIPWRVAALISDRIQVIKRGGIRLARLDRGAGGPSSTFHRPHVRHRGRSSTT